RYMKQIRYPFGRHYVEKALNAHPEISRMIIGLFKALLDPKNGQKNENMGADCINKIEAALEAVVSLDEDRILRMMTSLIKATLRTNYFQRREDGRAKEHLSVKLDSAAVPNMPKPHPYREIF